MLFYYGFAVYWFDLGTGFETLKLKFGPVKFSTWPSYGSRRVTRRRARPRTLAGRRESIGVVLEIKAKDTWVLVLLVLILILLLLSEDPGRQKGVEIGRAPGGGSADGLARCRKQMINCFKVLRFGIKAKLWWKSGEILARFWQSVLRNRKQKHKTKTQPYHNPVKPFTPGTLHCSSFWTVAMHEAERWRMLDLKIAPALVLHRPAYLKGPPKISKLRMQYGRSPY